MIILRASTELRQTFDTLLENMKIPVQWTGIFIVDNEKIILKGTSRSLIFSLGEKKADTDIVNIGYRETEVYGVAGNLMLTNTINMILYVFGKWGSIRLRVDHQYSQLNGLFNVILKSLGIVTDFTAEHLVFTSQGRRLTYEDVIELCINPPETDAQEDDRDHGLWHDLSWNREELSFDRVNVTVEERLGSRIGDNFYSVGYHCPRCDQPLFMTIFPPSAPFKIDTKEGDVLLARAFTCDDCNIFYTPVPRRLICEGQVYSMDFGEDRAAYEDYRDLLGRHGTREANAGFNRYADGRDAGEGEEEPPLDEACLELEEMSDEDLELLNDKIDEGFYSDDEVRAHEEMILAINREREQNRRELEEELERRRLEREQEEELERLNLDREREDAFSFDSEDALLDSMVADALNAGKDKAAQADEGRMEGTDDLQDTAFEDDIYPGEGAYRGDEPYQYEDSYRGDEPYQYGDSHHGDDPSFGDAYNGEGAYPDEEAYLKEEPYHTEDFHSDSQPQFKEQPSQASYEERYIEEPAQASYEDRHIGEPSQASYEGRHIEEPSQRSDDAREALKLFEDETKRREAEKAGIPKIIEKKLTVPQVLTGRGSRLKGKVLSSTSEEEEPYKDDERKAFPNYDKPLIKYGAVSEANSEGRSSLNGGVAKLPSVRGRASAKESTVKPYSGEESTHRESDAGEHPSRAYGTVGHAADPADGGVKGQASSDNKTSPRKYVDPLSETANKSGKKQGAGKGVGQKAKDAVKGLFSSLFGKKGKKKPKIEEKAGELSGQDKGSGKPIEEESETAVNGLTDRVGDDFSETSEIRKSTPKGFAKEDESPAAVASEEIKEKVDGIIKTAPKKNRKDLVNLVDALNEADPGGEFTGKYIPIIVNKVKELDEKSVAGIMDRAKDGSLSNEMDAFSQIIGSDILPELKEDVLGELGRKISAIKCQESELLCRKLQKDLADSGVEEPERHHYYRAKQILEGTEDPGEVSLMERAIDSYGTGMVPFEYPILIVDTSRGRNGKGGMILTPDHLFVTSLMKKEMIEVKDIDSIEYSGGLFGKGVICRYSEGSKIKLPYVVDSLDLEDYAAVLDAFVIYLKSRPDSRSLDYMSSRHHDFTICFRCGNPYRGTQECPRCGYKAK